MQWPSLRRTAIALATITTITIFFFVIGSYLYFTSEGPLVKEETVVIPKGSSVTYISQILKEHHIIRYPLWFTIVLRTYYQGKVIQAGEYLFFPYVTPQEAFKKLHKGEVLTHYLTIPEGMMVSRVLAMVATIPELAGTLPEGIKEGSLLPETYDYYYGDSRQQLVGRMQEAMQQVMEMAWQQRKEGLPLSSPQDALTLASIVEKETAIPEERGEVAAVFINRLRKSMRLQSDPTTIYGITQGKYVFEQVLSKKDLQTMTPYNTYMLDGLPAGPICNPGKASILSVLNPPGSNKLYFVADGKGGHIFSDTLEEHNRYVKQWRKKERESKLP